MGGGCSVNGSSRNETRRHAQCWGRGADRTCCDSQSMKSVPGVMALRSNPPTGEEREDSLLSAAER